jgi:hypothetical protein
METLLVITKDKKSANFIKKILKNLQDVKNVKSLGEEEKEDLALANAIEKGFTGNFVSVETLQKKLKK